MREKQNDSVAVQQQKPEISGLIFVGVPVAAHDIERPWHECFFYCCTYNDFSQPGMHGYDSFRDWCDILRGQNVGTGSIG